MSWNLPLGCCCFCLLYPPGRALPSRSLLTPVDIFVMMLMVVTTMMLMMIMLEVGLA